MKIEIVYLADHQQYKQTVAEWHQKQWGSSYSNWTILDWINFIKLNKVELPITLIALDADADNQIVGTVTLRTPKKEVFSGNTSIELAALYVPENYRRQGIASKLISVACEKADLFKYHEIVLFTYNSKEVYEKNGWQLGEIITYSNKTAQILRKSLPGTALRSYVESLINGVISINAEEGKRQVQQYDLAKLFKVLTKYFFNSEHKLPLPVNLETKLQNFLINALYKEVIDYVPVSGYRIQFDNGKNSNFAITQNNLDTILKGTDTVLNLNPQCLDVANTKSPHLH